MIYVIPTKRGLGVEIWGTYDDLSSFYDVLSKFWNDEELLNKKGFHNRDKLISGFSYEIRKAMEGGRQKRKSSHFSLDQNEYFGAKLFWVHTLFSMAAIRYNMRYYESNKYDIAMMLQIEFWIEKSMVEFDQIGGEKLIGFINNGLYGGNEYIYQYMRGINADYILLNGGKKAFRKLPELLRRGVFLTDEYKKYLEFLESEAKQLNCEVAELEIDDDNIEYENLVW